MMLGASLSGPRPGRGERMWSAHASGWKESQEGDPGYPVATVALYGPDDNSATESLSVSARRKCRGRGPPTLVLRRQRNRDDVDVAEEGLAFIPATGAKWADDDRIIGCPHEEGIDYEGSTCPNCPFWVGRDRWTGKRLDRHPNESPAPPQPAACPCLTLCARVAAIPLAQAHSAVLS